MSDLEDKIEEELSELDASDFKRREALRDIQQWKTILNVNPYKDSLNVVDYILVQEDHYLTTHIGGDGYRQVTLEGEKEPDQLLLKIDDNAENLHQNVENHFFQSMTEEKTEYEIKEFPEIAFELGGTYDETVEVPLKNYSNIEIRYPTQQSFYRQRISQNMEE